MAGWGMTAKNDDIRNPNAERQGARRQIWRAGERRRAENMELRNEAILKMRESPDFTDVKWRFWS
jgi:hypothetical protein